jgi:CBS domain containing-hemolysin-like protein
LITAGILVLLSIGLTALSFSLGSRPAPNISDNNTATSPLFSHDLLGLLKGMLLIGAGVALYAELRSSGTSHGTVFLWFLCLFGISILVDLLLFVLLTKKNGHIATLQLRTKRLNKWLQPLYNTLVPLFPQTMRQFKAVSHGTGLHRATRTDRKETMLKGIVQFAGETVKDIMTSRLDVLDLDITTPFSQVVRLISEDNYSRIPVYSGNKDNIVGVLYIKDLLPYLGKSDKFRWSFLVRPQLCVPETKKIDNLLREFQQKKIHIAVVVDEYGGVSGIVTLEDIIEEIVGEINDEYDDVNNPYITLGNNTYVFDAKTPLPDFSKLFDLQPGFFDEASDDADTLAGVLLEIHGDLPEKHQTITYKQFVFEILGVDERRITKVKVSVNPEILS